MQPVRADSGGEGAWESAARERNCYCGLWDKDPSLYLSRGYPRGYCGQCGRCGSPGHTRHFPGPVPYTGAWCDRCYRIVAWTWPFTTPKGWITLIGVLVAVAWIVHAIWSA